MTVYKVILSICVSLTILQEIKGDKSKDLQLLSEGKSVMNDRQLVPEILPKCAEGCLKPLILTVRASFVSGNNYERLVNTCDKLREVYECMDRIKKCQPNHLFRVFTDGLKYMCVEHPAAFRDLMECMDLHSHIATEDCEQKCSANKLIIGWFIYMAMRSTTFIKINENGAPPGVNVVFFRKITTEACTILQCYFLCLKTKYNARCHGIGGNLLMEVIVRPIAAMHESVLLSPIMNLVKLMMPIQCNFIMTDSGIAWQRVDPKLDQELKEFYANRTEPLVKFRLLPQNNSGSKKVAAKKRVLRESGFKRTESNNQISTNDHRKELGLELAGQKISAYGHNNDAKGDCDEKKEKKNGMGEMMEPLLAIRQCIRISSGAASSSREQQHNAADP